MDCDDFYFLGWNDIIINTAPLSDVMSPLNMDRGLELEFQLGQMKAKG